MLVKGVWDHPDSDGRDLLSALELETATPIMSQTRATGAALQIFESGGDYYIWNVIEGTASRFLTTSFDEILNTMNRTGGGTKALEASPCF